MLINNRDVKQSLQGSLVSVCVGVLVLSHGRAFTLITLHGPQDAALNFRPPIGRASFLYITYIGKTIAEVIHAIWLVS